MVCFPLILYVTFLEHFYYYFFLLGDLSSFCLYAVLCAASLSNMSSFYTEVMKGLGASARLFELRYRKASIPITGCFLNFHVCSLNRLLFWLSVDHLQYTLVSHAGIFFYFSRRH